MGACQAKESQVKKSAAPTKTQTISYTSRNTKPTQKTVGNASPGASPRSYDQHSGAEQYLRSLLEGAEAVLGGGFHFNSPAEQHYVTLTFINSCVEVTRTKFRLKVEVVVEIVTKIARELKLKTILKVVPDVKECCVDDGFARLLNAWSVDHTGLSKATPASAGKSVVDSKGTKNNNHTQSSFLNNLSSHLYSATMVPTTMDIFPTFAQGGDIMNEEQFGKFLRETQRNDVTDSQVIEKYKYRFGGAIHRYNFNTYMGSLLTNNALDPLRTADAWQDMTQPLTRYLIKTTRIESKNDLARALTDGSRAFVLNLNKNEAGVLFSGSCPLNDILVGIKTEGFLGSPYPILLCLSPNNNMPVKLKDELAENLTNVLGPMLAKGLMFEGAIISDPKFSPAAQRKKVLVLGYQSKLKPFVGCLVADMNRDGLGVRVTDVLNGTPAAKGGLTRDDWLTHLNGVAIKNKQHMREQLSKLKLGEEFTLRRENLEEIKIVVGGTVDAEDKSESTTLSNILFLKYTAKDNPGPWETQIFTAKTIHGPAVSRKKLDDHFAFYSSERGTDNVDYVDIATRMGIQLIDSGKTCQYPTWAKGRFVDNGHTGYLIKSDTEEKGTVNVTVDIIAGPLEINGPPLIKGTARVYGTGSARVDERKVTLKGCNDATVAVIECEFAQNGGSFCFTAAFPPALLRDGYRVLPLEQTGGPKDLGVSTIGAYCFIRRNK
ncbi:phospholipase C, delta [Trypanosoma grayi]|uniref:phospholipase C, delta n=1 Tax=Trypanosoma grayi TaxID=71804 RepID=UPI0004F476CD|nr:phospholipase C, delta [Trypanosoma grayi]KEG09700.1 phospholipase C, delta [Trypanosoma grayi]